MIDVPEQCWLRRHRFAAILASSSWLLLGLLIVTDRQLNLSQHLSGRYRAHAIPVALSQIYHGRAHDYTAYADLEMAFRLPRPVEEVIAEYADPNAPVGTSTYYWTADDRGLSDYVNIAFRLFGPRLQSLASLYYLLLGASVLCFNLAYWHRPIVLFLPVLALLGLIGFAHALPHYREIVLGDGRPWQEPISLYEARAFESIAVIGWLHLALLASSVSGRRMAWLTAIPQILLLIFLYHARSSLGWMYLALFVLCLARLIAGVRVRWQGGRQESWVFLRPLSVAGVVALSLVGLHQYKRAMYHPVYFEDRGSRSFWHNALMAYGYHPKLRAKYDIGIDDTKVIELVLREMQRASDPRLTPEWKLENIGGSLNGIIRFDWREYEAAARDTYVDIWQREPAQVFACYAWYKPKDLGRHARQAAVSLGRDMRAGTAFPLAIALVLVGGLLVAGWSRIKRDPDAGAQARALFGPALCLLAFSTIPAIAFYAALPTLSGFYLALPVCVGVVFLRTAGGARWKIASRLRWWKSTTRVEPSVGASA